MPLPSLVPSLHHFGPLHAERLVSVPAAADGRLVRFDRASTLSEALHDALRSQRATSGFAELFGIRLPYVRYVHPATGDGVRRAVSFTSAKEQRDVEIVQASALIGARFGEDFVHCHAMWRDADGALHGGHLLAETSVERGTGFAIVTATHGVDLVSDDDAETLMPTFTPHRSDRARSGTEALVPTIVARVLPNEDLSESAVAIARSAGYARAVVRAGTGSLIGADFAPTSAGRRRIVDGPATEVISVNGVVDAEAGTAQLTATLVDRHGQLHAGALTPGANPAAVTFELVLQEIR
jgi:predicted DNA-binding protein with PD1-like motif